MNWAYNAVSGPFDKLRQQRWVRVSPWFGWRSVSTGMGTRRPGQSLQGLVLSQGSFPNKNESCSLLLDGKTNCTIRSLVG